MEDPPLGYQSNSFIVDEKGKKEGGSKIITGAKTKVNRIP